MFQHQAITVDPTANYIILTAITTTTFQEAIPTTMAMATITHSTPLMAITTITTTPTTIQAIGHTMSQQFITIQTITITSHTMTISTILGFTLTSTFHKITTGHRQAF